MLSYKDTALRTLIDEKLAIKVLGVLGGYAQTTYQALLTDSFIDWYKDISKSYQKKRVKQGIRMDVLPPPPSTTQVLEVTLPGGAVATYSPGKGISFCMSHGGLFPSNFQSNGQTGEIVYHGTHLNLNLPLSSLRPTLSQIGANAIQRSVKKGLDVFYAEKISPLVKKLNSPFPSDSNQLIKDCREALAISDIYRVLGDQKATGNVFSIENRLGVALHDTTAESTLFLSHDERMARFNEELDLFEHSSLNSQYGEAQKAQNNFLGTLQNYGFYLGNYVGNGGIRDIFEKIALFRKSLGLLREAVAKGFKDKHHSILTIENELACALGDNARGDSPLSLIERVDLFKEAISLLEHATAQGNEEAKSNLGVILNEYVHSCSFPIDESISLLRKALKLLKESKKSEHAQQEFLRIESNLGAMLAKKARDDSTLTSTERVDLFKESLVLLKHAATHGDELAKTNRGVVVGEYARICSLPIDESISLLRKALKLLEKESKKSEHAQRGFLSIKTNLGVTLANKANDITLSHEERVELFEESLTLLKHTMTLGFDRADVYLGEVFDDYGVYLCEYVVKIKKLPPNKGRPILQKASELFKEAKVLGESHAAGNLLEAEQYLKTYK